MFDCTQGMLVSMFIILCVHVQVTVHRKSRQSSFMSIQNVKITNDQ